MLIKEGRLSTAYTLGKKGLVKFAFSRLTHVSKIILLE